MATQRTRLICMAVLAYLAFVSFCIAAHLALVTPGENKTEETGKPQETQAPTTEELIVVPPPYPEYALPPYSLVEPTGFWGTDAVIVGKDGYLYEPWYINEYFGYDWAYVYTTDEELLQRANVLRFIQDELEKRNIAFVVAISPSKASSLPQFIPDFYKDEHYALDDDYVRPYLRFRAMLKETGVYFIDSQSLYKKIGLTNTFPKTGTHWNKLASFETTKAIMQEIDRQTGRNIQKLVFDEIVQKTTPAPFYANEQDIFNIGYAGNRQEMREAITDDFYYWPNVYLDSAGSGDRLGHAVIQGGSFSHDFVYYFKDKKIAKSVTSFYYNNDGKVDIDWAKEIEKAELVLFEVNEQFVYNMGGGTPGDTSTNIIDSLYFWMLDNLAE
ncbi:MAG: hypothetical protein FWH48_08980 [Oscillospiraceae bacterium]|nr:hypothetical protein [Oscillospiraceae bacterium]